MMSKPSFSGRDIFNVPLEYVSPTTIRLRWMPYLSNASRLLKLDIHSTGRVSMYDINNMVFHGFLSFATASYFLLGKYTLYQEDYLLSFVNFVKDNSQLSIEQIKLLWLEKKQERVPENTFLFPLAEPGSSIMTADFERERNRYKLLSLNDLPPDDYEV